MPLGKYNAKRNFAKTAEPAGKSGRKRKVQGLSFVIQKHWASRLHYDFRLEHDGVLLSWAVPKGPSFDPADKQTAIHVEDHPVTYAGFEGTIPAKQYGAGTVIVWDSGTWEPVGDVQDSIAKGKLLFHLHGQKLAGMWELVRISKPTDKKQDHWILFKKRGDAWARPRAEYDVITALPDSVVETPLGLVEEREPRGAPRATSAPKNNADRDVDLSEAVAADLPEKLEPQLATLASGPPATGSWIIESKFDGYRILVRIEAGKARLFTRNGHDWTHKMQALAESIEQMGISSAWLDGEIAVLNENGVPDFNALQNAMGLKRSATNIKYYLFDVPFLGGMDLRRVPLWSRRKVLQGLFSKNTPPAIRFSDEFDAPAGQLVEAACRIGLEGIMLKNADDPYTSGRTDTWLKLKCGQRQEFVVVGFTDRTNSPGEVGSLLLGYHRDGALRYGGSVGTGWSHQKGKELHDLMRAHETDTPTVNPNEVKPGRWSRRAAGSERWVKPVLVVEVGFSEWTPDGHVRHPTFKGMRTDKPAKAITREIASSAPGGVAVAKPAVSVKVSNPERVIDPSTGLTKLDLVRYYESIADWILPHLKNRPVSLVRAPTGITGELFFQKHPETRMPGLTALDPALWPGHASLLMVDSVEALLAAAQMNVVEFHTWNSTIAKIDQPDRIVFDLDPGEGVTWPMIQEAATLTRVMLTELGLQSWVKTSGGKGVHVVVPIAPKHNYETIKAFSQAVVKHMALTIPGRFVAKSGGSNRVGKIFIDYLRNGHGQTTAAAFSARSRPGLGVSVTLGWDDLPHVKSGSQWTIATAREYLSFRKDDPWQAYSKARQTLSIAFKRLGFKPSE